MQSGIGNVAAGSLFATMTCWRMTGFFGKLLAAGVTMIGAGKIAKIFGIWRGSGEKEVFFHENKLFQINIFND